jgi:hypothetical protein
MQQLLVKPNIRPSSNEGDLMSEKKKPMTPSQAGRALQNPHSREKTETQAAKILNAQRGKKKS